MYIIGIAGGTGSGKTTVVRKIMEALECEGVAVIPLDSYYNDNTHLTMEQRRLINYDHPDAFDWKLLKHHVPFERNHSYRAVRSDYHRGYHDSVSQGPARLDGSQNLCGR